VATNYFFAAALAAGRAAGLRAGADAPFKILSDLTAKSSAGSMAIAFSKFALAAALSFLCAL